MIQSLRHRVRPHRRVPASSRSSRTSWLLLIHQIPPRPGYLRVKIWRRLQRIGAVPLKNSVYLLPDGEQAREDFEWIRREIKAGGGDASICGARFIEGLTDAQGAALFHAARDPDYAALVDEARRVRRRLGGPRRGTAPSTLAASAEVDRLRRRLADVEAIDFFTAPGRRKANRAIAELERESEARTRAVSPPARRAWSRHEVRGRTWVTRQHVHVDRMASAWLIRRFIDPKARFRFVPPAGHRPRLGEIRFDMFEAEFTHDGDHCTFEVLLRRFGLRDRALEADRRDRPRHRPQGRQVRPARHARDRAADRRDRPGAPGRCGTARAQRRRVRRALFVRARRALTDGGA